MVLISGILCNSNLARLSNEPPRSVASRLCNVRRMHECLKEDQKRKEDGRNLCSLETAFHAMMMHYWPGRVVANYLTDLEGFIHSPGSKLRSNKYVFAETINLNIRHKFNIRGRREALQTQEATRPGSLLLFLGDPRGISSQYCCAALPADVWDRVTAPTTNT